MTHEEIVEIVHRIEAASPVKQATWSILSLSPDDVEIRVYIADERASSRWIGGTTGSLDLCRQKIIMDLVRMLAGLVADVTHAKATKP